MSVEGEQESEFDPCNLDREEFNVDLCMLKYSENCDFQQIYSRMNNLDVEIQNLNSGIQNILYDNYTEFITASHVVSKIKNDFGKMAGDIELLQSKMKTLGDTSAAILEKLQPRRNHALELMRSRGNLSKLITLIDLVPRMRDHLANGEYIAAAKYYLKAQNQLKKYQHLPSFKGIVQESAGIISVIRHNLKERFNCYFYSAKELCSMMELLLALDSPADAVLKNVFSNTTKHFDDILSKVELSSEASAVAADGEKTSELKVTKCLELGLSYLEILSKVVVGLRNVLLKRNLLSISVLGEFMETSIERLFEKIRKVLRLQFAGIGDEFLANILDGLYRQWHDCCILVPYTDVAKKDSGVILDVCRDRCEYHLQKLKSYFRGCLVDLRKRISVKFPRLDKILLRFITNVDGVQMTALESLTQYVRPEHKYSRNVHFRKAYCKLLVREGVFVSFIRYMNAEILSTISTNSREKINPALHVFLSRYALELHQVKVGDIFTSVDEKLHSSAQHLIIIPASEIASECEITAKKMLTHYVHSKHGNMSAMLTKSMKNKNWLDAKEPWKVSSVIRRVIEDFDVITYETELLLDDAKSSARERSNPRPCLSSASRISSPERDSIEDRVSNRINKLFTRPPMYSETVEFTRDSVLSCVIEITLKSLLEHIRLRTFSRFGFQQMQVDVHCLESRLLRDLENEDDFISLFDDIMSSCYNRTIQPVLMNLSVVLVICQSF